MINLLCYISLSTYEHNTIIFLLLMKKNKNEVAKEEYVCRKINRTRKPFHTIAIC